MSRHKQKFYVVVYDVFANKWHVIDLWKQQFQKLLKAIDNDLERLMKMLDFKMGRLYIRHLDIMLSYETFMTQRAKAYT